MRILGVPECGTCGNQSLRISSIAGGPWEVTCKFGHLWVLNPTQDVIIEVGEGSATHVLRRLEDFGPS
jgi:hypothetical protein